jgi:hypothetical protein
MSNSTASDAIGISHAFTHSSSLFHVVSTAGWPGTPHLGWRRSVISVRLPRPVSNDSFDDHCADILDGNEVKYVAMLLLPGWDVVKAHTDIVSWLEDLRTPVLFVVHRGRERAVNHPLLTPLEDIGYVTVKHDTQSINDPDVITATQLFAQDWYHNALQQGTSQYQQWILAPDQAEERRAEVTEATPDPFPTTCRNVRMLLEAQKEALFIVEHEAQRRQARAPCRTDGSGVEDATGDATVVVDQSDSRNGARHRQSMSVVSFSLSRRGSRRCLRSASRHGPVKCA